MLNSFSRFLNFVQSVDNPTVFLAEMRVRHAEGMVSAKAGSLSSEEINQANQLRELVGRDAWSVDGLSKLFTAAQQELPSIYDNKPLAFSLGIGVRDALKKARDYLSYIAPLTPIKSDDALVVIMDAILSDAELFGWFSAKVADNKTGTLSVEGPEPPERLQLSLKNHKIDWSKLVEYAPTIIKLVSLFL